MSENGTVHALDGLRTRLIYLHDTRGLSWRKIALQREFRGIPYSTLRAVAVEGREPKDEAQRLALGLPPKPVPVYPCPECGHVHKLAKGCEQKPTPAGMRRLALWVTEEQFDIIRAAWDSHPDGRVAWNMEKATE